MLKIAQCYVCSTNNLRFERRLGPKAMTGHDCSVTNDIRAPFDRTS